MKTGASAAAPPGQEWSPGSHHPRSAGLGTDPRWAPRLGEHVLAQPGPFDLRRLVPARRWSAERAIAASVVVDPALTTVDLNCAQTMRCRIVTVLEEGTIQVVPEHPVTTAAVHNSPTSS